MIWGLLLGAHLVGIVGYSLLLRKEAVTHKFHPWVLATLLHTGIMVPMLLAIPFLEIQLHRFDAVSIALSAVTAVLSIIFLLAVTKALERLETATYAVVYNIRIVVAAVLAVVFLSEVPSGLQILGGLFVVAALFAIRQKGSQKSIKLGLAWAAMAAVLVSIINVLEKHLIAEVGLFTVAPLIAAAVGIIMWSVIIIKRYDLPKKYIFTRQIAGLAVLRAISAWGFIFALAAGALVSVAVFISALSIVFLVALGGLLLHEKDNLKRKYLALLFAVIGLVLLFAGSPTPTPKTTIVKTAAVVTHSTDMPDEKKPSSTEEWRGAKQDPKKIIIPSIGVDALVQNVGIDQNTQIAVPNNIHKAGWFVDSVRPGGKGLSIIDGHLDGRMGKAVFYELGRLKPGETFTIVFGDDSRKQFTIKDTKTVSLEEAPSVLFSQNPRLANELKLITCGGFYDKTVKTYDKRIIISATILD